MNNRLLSKLYQRATTVDHSVILQELCVYCGAPVDPRRRQDGSTRHLDHLIPIRPLEIARRHHPSLDLRNWLLPCCRACNMIAGGCIFLTFADKFDFVRAYQHSNAEWQITDNPRNIELLPLRVTEDFRSLLRPMNDEFREGQYIVKSDDNIWDRNIKRMIPLCNSVIPFTEK
jgi:hypothetical protein